MGAPITWRNVDSPGLGSPGQSLLGAQQSINGAFDAISNALRERQTIDSRNGEVLQANGRQAFLDALQSAQTPEELAALQASGKLDALKQGLNAQSLGSLNGAVDARLTSLRQGTLANQEYAASQAGRATAPAVDAAMAQAATGDFKSAREAIAALPIPNKAQHLAKINDLEQTSVARTRETTRYDNQTTLDNLKITEAQRAAAEADRARKFDAVAENQVQAFQAQVEARRKKFDPVFAQFDKEQFLDTGGNVMKIPRNSDGSVNFASMGTELRSQVNDYLKNWHGSSETVDTLSGSDTAARRVATEALRQAGARTSDLARLEPVLSAGFNTTPTQLQGKDLADAQQASRERAAVDEANSESFVRLENPSSGAAVVNEMADYINKNYGGADSWRAEALRKAVARVAANGIPVKDKNGKEAIGANGQPVKMMPSAETFKSILQGMDTNVFNYIPLIRGRADDFEAALQKYFDDPNTPRAAAAAYQSSLNSIKKKLEPLPQK